MPTISEEVKTPKVGRNPRVRAELTRELVSARVLSLSTYLRSLPRYIDDIGRDFGDDIYQRLRLDPQYAQCLLVLKLAILAQGVEVEPAVGEEDPNHQQAVEMAEFCRRNLQGLRAPFVAHTLWNMLDALDQGNKVAEQTYYYPESGPDVGKLCLQSIKVKPRESVAFVVDTMTNVVGILGIRPGQYGYAGMGVIDAKSPNLLPRKKFLILTHRPENEDPRGTSAGRPAYHPWWFKAQLQAEYLKHLARFGSPSPVATTGQAAENVQDSSADGSPLVDEDGNPVYITPEAATLRALQDIANGSVAVLPFGTTLDLMEPKTGDSPLLQGIEFCNKEMSKCLLGQTLATGEGEHQARAAAEVHQDVLGLLVSHEKRGVEQAVRCDVCMPLVEYNYGPEAIPLTPNVTLGDTSEEDIAALITAVSRLVAADYFSPEQLRALDALLGMPIRSQEAVDEETKARKKALETLPGEGGGGQDDEEEEDGDA